MSHRQCAHFTKQGNRRCQNATAREQVYCSYFERGSRTPNLTTLQRYSDAIGARITVEDNQQ